MEKTDEHLSFDAVIVAAGDFPQHPLPLSILHDAPHIICCDGAAQTLISKGIIPHAIVGDGDSLPI
ncbi:MAG: thiamine diphosphokinase, partial [Bacteroidaceae bacterium]|nr:thiamine diphosphokinase [Bacteroidaceae bacterium]